MRITRLLNKSTGHQGPRNMAAIVDAYRHEHGAFPSDGKARAQWVNGLKAASPVIANSLDNDVITFDNSGNLIPKRR